ncbi:type II toxin-antitoxin system VapC family toxin [bacterium]|nr:type II toxin-antitoxin system VapC family toxin [bacterium]
MRHILIDTNIYVAFKRNDQHVLKSLQHVDHIGIDTCVLAELYSGFRLGTQTDKNHLELEAFINSPRIFIYKHDTETAEFYANIYTALRKNGTPIPTNYIWIAAVAMQNGLGLYTRDAHFKKIPGLMLY